jgi:hypothetical protein
MKKITILVVALLFTLAVFSQKDWGVIQGKITSPWAEKINISQPHAEYPRPQMERKNWMNLNGPWKYSILPKAQEVIPTSFADNILVPFAVESALSGVGKTVGKDSVLWYQRTVAVPSSLRNGNVLLHFGATKGSLASVNVSIPNA